MFFFGLFRYSSYSKEQGSCSSIVRLRRGMKVCFVSMLLNLQTRSFELLFNCCYLLAIERCFQQWRPTNVYHSSMVMDGYHLFTYSIGLPITSLSTVVWYLIVWQQWNASMVLKEHGLVEWFLLTKSLPIPAAVHIEDWAYWLQTWLCMLWEAFVYVVRGLSAGFCSLGVLCALLQSIILIKWLSLIYLLLFQVWPC
jgi:hypothetical protein